MDVLYCLHCNERSSIWLHTSFMEWQAYSNSWNLFLAERFIEEIGSQYGIVSGTRENSLYNALWVVQALLRKG
jgi:hypothetical protein